MIGQDLVNKETGKTSYKGCLFLLPRILDGTLSIKLSVFSRQERCVMKKEIYRVKRPGYIVFGNSEDYGKREHRGHIVDYSPANCFSAGVILTENGSEQNPVCSMSICFAREDLLSRIMGEDTPSECVYEMETFPQTRKFLLEIDGEWDEIENDGSGSCCEFKKLFHITKQGKFCDGAILSIKLPEKTDFSSMKQMAKYYFQNMRLASGTDNGHNAKSQMGLCFG